MKTNPEAKRWRARSVLVWLAASWLLAVSVRADQAPTGPASVASAPTLTAVAGDQQKALPGEFNAKPFDLAVWNAAATTPLVDVPVTFTVESGGGVLAASKEGAALPSSSLTLKTDQDGTVQAYYRQPLGYGIQSRIKASAGNRELVFETSTLSATEAFELESAGADRSSGRTTSAGGNRSGAGVVIGFVAGRASTPRALSATPNVAALTVSSAQVVLRTPKANYAVSTATWAIATYSGQ